MQKIILIIIISVFFSACSENKIIIPDDVLNQKEMTSILTDIHIAQASISSQSRQDTAAITMKEYTSSILKQHNIKREDFLRSLKFYGDNPELLQNVYDSVITGLSRMQGEADRTAD